MSSVVSSSHLQLPFKLSDASSQIAEFIAAVLAVLMSVPGAEVVGASTVFFFRPVIADATRMSVLARS